MEPRVHGVDYNIESNLEAMDVEIPREMWLQKRNLLTSTFGTHKSKLQVSDLKPFVPFVFGRKWAMSLFVSLHCDL